MKRYAKRIRELLKSYFGSKRGVEVTVDESSLQEALARGDRMRTIQLDLGSECELIGALHESDDVRDLSQDMLEIRMPSGMSVEAGWVPEADPDGAYEVLLCRGSDIVAKVTKPTAAATKLVIESLARPQTVAAAKVAIELLADSQREN